MHQLSTCERKGIILPHPERRPVAALLGNAHFAGAAAEPGHREQPQLDTLVRLGAALAGLAAYDVRYMEYSETLPLQLAAEPPEFVLNLSGTGYRNQAAFQYHVLTLLDVLGIAYSGPSPTVLRGCGDRTLVTALARNMDLPVPAERCFPNPAAALASLRVLPWRMSTADTGGAMPFPLPALIKSAHASGAFGVPRDGLVRTQAEAYTCLSGLARTHSGHPVLVQEFLPGPAYSVGLIGNPDDRLEALPVLRTDFSDLPGNFLPADGQLPAMGALRRGAAQLPAAELARLVENSRHLFTRLGLRDWARIDFRADATGTLRLLGVNPNPSCAFDSRMVHMARLAGRDCTWLLERLTEGVRARLVRQGRCDW